MSAKSLTGEIVLRNAGTAISLLILSNMMVYSIMFIIYILGKDSILSTLLIYLPITFLAVVLVKDKYSLTYIFSTILAILHGFAHVIYPFLDEVQGVNHEVDVWQDQFLHFLQAVLFSSLFNNDSSKGIKMSSLCITLGTLMTVVLGYVCWGRQCHDFYVWVTLFSALSSGLHFATGTLFQTTKDISTFGFALQGTYALITYFMFKASDDVLKIFALCRFFEVYFIAPHYIGFLNSRYVITKTLPNYEEMSRLAVFLNVIGVYRKEISFYKFSYFTDYFFISVLKND